MVFTPNCMICNLKRKKAWTSGEALIKKLDSELGQLGNPSFNGVRVSFHLLWGVISRTKCIANLLGRELSQKRAYPLGIGTRDMFANPMQAKLPNEKR